MNDSKHPLPDDMIRLIVDTIAADAPDDGFCHMCTRLLCKSQVPFVRGMKTASSSLLTITLSDPPSMLFCEFPITWVIDYGTACADFHGYWHQQTVEHGSLSACCHGYCNYIAVLRARVGSISGRSFATLRFARSVRRVRIRALDAPVYGTCAIHVDSFGINKMELTIRGTKRTPRIKLPGVLPSKVKRITIEDCYISSGPEFWNTSRHVQRAAKFQRCTLRNVTRQLHAVTFECTEDRFSLSECMRVGMAFVALLKILPVVLVVAEAFIVVCVAWIYPPAILPVAWVNRFAWSVGAEVGYVCVQFLVAALHLLNIDGAETWIDCVTIQPVCPPCVLWKWTLDTLRDILTVPIELPFGQLDVTPWGV